MTTSSRILIAVSALCVTHCATVTPVTPAPVEPDQQPQLEAALLGQCHVTGTQKPGGAIKEAKGIHWTFSPGGKLHQWLDVGFGRHDDFAYRVEGRNIVTTGAFKTMRLEDWSGTTLKFFMYETTENYYCAKEQA
jgi:hypothetical protein